MGSNLFPKDLKCVRVDFQVPFDDLYYGTSVANCNYISNCKYLFPSL